MHLIFICPICSAGIKTDDEIPRIVVATWYASLECSSGSRLKRRGRGKYVIPLRRQFSIDRDCRRQTTGAREWAKQTARVVGSVSGLHPSSKCRRSSWRREIVRGIIQYTYTHAHCLAVMEFSRGGLLSRLLSGNSREYRQIPRKIREAYSIHRYVE